MTRAARYGVSVFHVSEDGYPSLTEALLSITRRVVAGQGERRTADALLVPRTTLRNWLDYGQVPSGDLIDAAVAVYGLRLVVAEMNRLRALGLKRQGQPSQSGG